MESNISRDHIALEAMKCIMMTAKRRRTLWNRIVTLFFPSKEVSITNYNSEKQAKAAYQKLTLAHRISPVENPIQIRDLRRTIARLNTELTNKQ